MPPRTSTQRTRIVRVSGAQTTARWARTDMRTEISRSPRARAAARRHGRDAARVDGTDVCARARTSGLCVVSIAMIDGRTRWLVSCPSGKPGGRPGFTCAPEGSGTGECRRWGKGGGSRRQARRHLLPGEEARARVHVAAVEEQRIVRVVAGDGEARGELLPVGRVGVAEAKQVADLVRRRRLHSRAAHARCSGPSQRGALCTERTVDLCRARLALSPAPRSHSSPSRRRRWRRRRATAARRA